MRTTAEMRSQWIREIEGDAHPFGDPEEKLSAMLDDFATLEARIEEARGLFIAEGRDYCGYEDDVEGWTKRRDAWLAKFGER